MHIEELHLENFRGFKELTLKFSSKLAVIIGVKGSGKSSILDSLSLLLTHLSNNIIEELETSALQTELKETIIKSPMNNYSAMTNYPKIEMMDINTDAKEGHIKAKLNLHDGISQKYKTSNQSIPDDQLQKENYLPTSLDKSIFLEFGNSPSVFHTIKVVNSKVVNSPLGYYNLIYQSLTADQNSNIPIFLHCRTNRFITNRVYQEIFKALPKQFPQLSAYQGCTSIKQNDFTTFFQWFRTQEDIENEERLEVSPEYRDKQLEAVKKAITNLLGDEYVNLRVKRTSNQMIVHKKGEELNVSQLSDGEKGLLAMVGDIARRLAIANPSLDNPLEGEGVILIDEIELHLHPQWQRKIIPNLIKTFPNCQFIVTTHSPQVLSNVHKENVFIIEDFKLVEHTPHTYGRDSNSILFELMGVKKRPEETHSQELIDRCFRLIDEGQIEKAKNELQTLSNLLGEDEEAVVELNALTFFFKDN